MKNKKINISRFSKILFFTLGMLVLGNTDLGATHIVGAELRYKHLYDDMYELTLTFRRDCDLGAPNAGFDNPAVVWVFNGNGNLQTNVGINGRIKMQFNPDDTLNAVIMSDCGFEGTQVCVHETHYKEVVRLPFNPDGYILTYQRCCRNATLQNILDPLDTGGTWWVEIPATAQIEGNSSPVFANWADIYICANEDLNFDHSATDADGDSLVYKLCTPYSGGTEADPIPTSPPYPPYDQVPWNVPGGYDLNNLLGGTPLQINPQTGILTGMPNTVGQFLVGVCVEEYRNGVKIGEVRRDFQYNVRICSDPPSAEFEANEGDCNGPEVAFDNQSVGGMNYQWNFDYPNQDTLFMSNDENPIFTYPQEGVYNVQLIVTRGADECSDTIVKQVAALYSDIDVKYNLEIFSCNEDGGYTIRLIDKSEEPEQGFDIIGSEWVIIQNGQESTFIGSVVTTSIGPDDFIIKLQTESETGCKKSRIDTINISDFDHIADFEYALDGCPDTGNLATITLTDVSDPLNIYDSPQGYQWTIQSLQGETTGDQSTITVNVSQDETITASLLVDFGGNCTASITKDITVEDILPQASYGVTATGCPDDGTVDITIANTSNTFNDAVASYWEITVAGNTTIGNDSEISINIPKDSLVELFFVSTFDNGCTDTIVDSFIPGPFATIHFYAEPFKICIGDSMHIVSNPNSDFTYTWEPLTGLVFDSADDHSNPLLVGIEDMEYTVTVSDGLCSITSTLAVIALDNSNLQITGDSITCDGHVNLSASGGIGEGEFIWSTTSDFLDTIHTGQTLETTFSGQEQTYYAAFTGESCNDPYAERTVKLSDIYDVAFNGDPVRVCLSDTIPLLANPNPELTYEWSPLTGIYFANPGDGSSAQVIGIQDMTYHVTISDDYCSLDTTIEVVIADSQDFKIEGDSIVCDQNVQLIASGATGIGTYQWSTDPDFNTIIHTGDTLITTLGGLSNDYFVTYTDKTCGDLVLNYHVRQYVFDILSAEPVMICPGDTITYPVSNQGEGPVTFLWDENSHITGPLDDGSIFVGVGINETEDFELAFTATSPTGCIFRDTISFEIAENPIVDFNFTLTECGEYKVCFHIDGDYNGFPVWNFGDPDINTDTSLEPSPCYTYNHPGVYEVSLSNISSFCPFDTVKHMITINDDIVLDKIDPQVVCLDSIVHMTATSSSHNISYVWCSIDGDTIVSGPDYSATVSEPYQVILKGEDPNGCSAMDTIDIGPFVFDITDNVPEVFCKAENTEIEIMVNGTQDGYSFEWGPQECVVSGGDTGNPVLIAAAGKQFVVTITYDELGCEFVNTYDIITTSFDIDLEAIPDTVINQGDEVDISVIDPDNYEYMWSDGSTGEVLTDTPPQSTTYSVTVTDEKGCTASDSIFVRVRIPECNEDDVYLPTAFTPNGDGVNDIWYLRSNFIKKMELIVYNRWGEEVFRSTEQKVGWDGTYNGKKLEPDAFAYALKVTCINDVEYHKRGNVNLLK